MPTLVIIAFIVCSVAALAQWRRRCVTRRFFARQYRDPNTPLPAAGGLRCLCLLAAALAIGAAALQARQERAARQKAPATLCFLLDCSTSMLAAGAEDTRLAEAKTAITNILAAMPERELCLISFAGNALLDFPPSRDRRGFLRALAAVEPSPALPAGSSPSQALQAATALLSADGSYPSPANAVLIMLSDGEINDPTPSLLELAWLSRAHPFLHLLCGLPGQDSPIPALQGTLWLQDPESGEIATSRADEQTLARLAALSPLPAEFLPVQASTAQILALLRRYSDADNNSPLGMTHRTLALLALAALLAAAWPERSKQLQQPRSANSRQRRSLLQPRIRLPLLLLTLLGASFARGDDIPTALRENAATRAEALTTLRTAIARDKHDKRERARLLSNYAALLILEAKEAIAEGALAEAQQQAAAARELSREALRLQPGQSEALQNLAAAWHTLQQAQVPQTQENSELTEQTAQPAAAGSAANDSAPSTPDTAPPDTPEAQDAARQPGTGSPSQANANPPQRLTDEKHLPTSAEQGMYSEGNSAGSGSWRELQLQRHYRPPRPPGVKPW
jgi:Ca-activated chloride channel family protein